MSAWQDSTRRDRLPSDWPQIRKRILRRDQRQCQVLDEYDDPCLEPANEVDHKRAGDDHSGRNLQAICEWHHKKKSSQEGNDARRRKQFEINNRFRTAEDHPGLK